MNATIFQIKAEDLPIYFATREGTNLASQALKLAEKEGKVWSFLSICEKNEYLRKVKNISN